jgi:hypothetical protein
MTKRPTIKRKTPTKDAMEEKDSALNIEISATIETGNRGDKMMKTSCVTKSKGIRPSRATTPKRTKANLRSHPKNPLRHPMLQT